MNENVLWPGRLLPDFLGNRRRIIAPERRESQRSTDGLGPLDAGKSLRTVEEVPMSTLTPRRFRAKLITGLMALVVLLGVGLWYVSFRGGWRSFVKIQPILDSSSPRSQNGYTVASVTAIDDPQNPGAVFMLIVPPFFPACTTGNHAPDGTVRYELADKKNPFIIQASAHMSSGDTANIGCDIIGTDAAPKYLRLTLPGGYSNDCRFADVTLVPANGSFPRWRITRLPYMRQNISDHPTLIEHITKRGIAAEAHAYWVRGNIYLRVIPNIPPNSHQWELTINRVVPSFEEFGRHHDIMPETRGSIEGRGGKFTSNDLAGNGTLTADFASAYRSTNRYTQIDCALNQFETVDEQVTFRNIAEEKSAKYNDAGSGMHTYFVSIPKSITLHTPSGLSVTLPVHGEDSENIVGDKLNFLLTVKPRISPGDLPHSPLVRMFGKPITVSVGFSPPDVSSESIIKSDDTQDYLLWRQLSRFSIPPPRRDFTVILHERVELQTIPMTFTVPVSDTPPPDFHW
jgi:hypothetical protein